jgi:glycosyltransferase involved in cell wall biosynthesis
MRIAHVIDYFHTDVGYQEYFLALEQARAGHAVRVISSAHRHHTVAVVGPDEGIGQAELDAAGVEVVRLPARQLGHDRAWLHGLEQGILAHRPDAIHCHGPFHPTSIRVARCAHKAGIALLVDTHIHEAIAPSSTRPVGRAGYRAYRAVAGATLRRATGAWVANGPYEAAFLEQRLGLPVGSVDVIPLGFDPAVFSHDTATGRSWREGRAWGDDLVVAVTGKVHARKRADLVAGACERILLERGVHLALAGDVDADVLASIKAAAPDLNRSGRVHVLPMLGRHDLAALYNAADIVCFARLPSISIYEAVGTGAKVVVGRDRFSDWLAGMHGGILSVDLDDLAPALAVPEDRALRSRRAATAREVFSWAVISDDFIRRYATIRRSTS